MKPLCAHGIWLLAPCPVCDENTRVNSAATAALADLLALPRYAGPPATVAEMHESIGDVFAEPEPELKPLPVKADVRLDAYGLVQRAVEEGVTRGYWRAFKHTETPGEEALRASIEREVMDALCEVLRFD